MSAEHATTIEANTADTTADLKDPDDAVASMCNDELDVSANCVLPRWNHPRTNIFRFILALLGFVIMGMHDASIGALIPYLEAYYHVSHTLVSTLFIVPCLGYLAAALLNNLIHYKWGRRGVAILGPLAKLICYIPISLHPPFPVLPVIFIFSAFGNGLLDAAWNAWVGNMLHASELIGILHASYGLGATIGPLVATSLVVKAQRPWYSHYYVMTALTVLESLCAVPAFWPADGSAYRSTMMTQAGLKRTTTRTALKSGVTWLFALFFLGVVGVEVCISGWAATFMLEIRHADPFLAGITVTMFSLGLTAGRLLMGFVAGRVGEKPVVFTHVCMAVVLELLYWLIPNTSCMIVCVTFFGFFLGPLFPAAVVVVIKTMPADYHISTIGFGAAFATGGGAFLPFAVGAIAEKRGVAVLQPFVLTVLIALLIVWALIPGGGRSRKALSRE